uniref:Uncharacterized protein n=1 Tax=Salix viminalis TaxID=40686 RepID=A0A6N2M9Y8_SALVM
MDTISIPLMKAYASATWALGVNDEFSGVNSVTMRLSVMDATKAAKKGIATGCDRKRGLRTVESRVDLFERDGIPLRAGKKKFQSKRRATFELMSAVQFLALTDLSEINEPQSSAMLSRGRRATFELMSIVQFLSLTDLLEINEPQSSAMLSRGRILLFLLQVLLIWRIDEWIVKEEIQRDREIMSSPSTAVIVKSVNRLINQQVCGESLVTRMVRWRSKKVRYKGVKIDEFRRQIFVAAATHFVFAGEG